MSVPVGAEYELEELVEAVCHLPNFPFLLELMLERICRKLDTESAGVMLYDPSTNRLELQSPAFGLNDLQLIESYSVGLDEASNAVSVFLSGKPYYSNDVQNDPHFIKKYTSLFGVRTGMSVPLVVSGKRIGVLHINNKRTGEFTNRDLEATMSFALEFAALIEQSRAFEEMRQREEVTAALYEIAYMISEGTEIDVIIRLILEKLKMYLKTEVVGYCSFDTVCKESHCLMLHGSKELSECKFSGVFPLSFWERLDHEDLLLTNLNQLAFPPEFGDWVKRNQLVYGLFSPIQSSERTPRMMFALDRNHRHVTGRKQDLLKRFVQQAALAVQRSDLESKQRDLVEKLQHTNNVLMYAVNIHSKLMQMILEGGQYESFAKTIQELVQGKVVLFDEHFQPLSDEHLLGHEILELVTKDIKPRIPFFGTISLELDELLIHVSSSTDGSSIFGYVMVVKTKDAVDHFDRVAIEQAALLLALRQMQRKIEMELEGRLVFEWLDDVLTGSTSEEVLLRRGKHLGFTDSRCSYLLLCGIERMNNHEGIHRILSERQPIYSTIRQQLSNYQWSNFITVRGDTIAILLLQDETETSDISERASTLFQWIQRKFPNHIRRGVLMMFDGNLGSLRLAYEDGEKILSLMRSTDKQGLVESGDLGSYRFFLRSHNYEQLKQFAFQTLEPLFRLDTQQREVLLQTLAVYTEGGGELKETAERLHVHRNTLIYRLKKIEDLLGTNIRNSDKRFDIQLACRIYNLFESLAEK